ncbi:MAG: cytochrome c oxidase assembly protein [Rhodospirillales bacterium]|nr:cytochrome c oxidase assembly protein [Rhodospirillales bacterium]
MRNRRQIVTAALLVALVSGMTGLAFASVPLYRLFCQVTGFGGTPRVETNGPTNTGPVSTRHITVRFDSNVNSALPWRFKPVQRQMNVRIGEATLAHFTAENLAQEPAIGTATFNVTPHKAAQYFAKVQCFCFDEQRLEAGQRVDMPVSFFIDPEILDDPNAQDVSTITLSYTFFRSDSL